MHNILKMYIWGNGWTSRWINRWMAMSVDGWMDEQIDGWMNEQVDVWMNRWMDGMMGGGGLSFSFLKNRKYPCLSSSTPKNVSYF